MKQQKNRFSLILRIGAFLFLSCIILVASLNLYITNYAQPYILSSTEACTLDDIDCIMVLGCGVNGSTPSPLLADRLRRGVEVYRTTSIPKILMTGDHGRIDYDEVNVMKQYAMSFGIDEKDIFMDHAGFSTYESMYRAKEIFGIKRMVIVTQKYHLSRAVYIANQLGIEAYGVASDYREFGGQFYRDFREVLARVKDIFTTTFQPEPTYLGEFISISGDGTMTDG